MIKLKDILSEQNIFKPKVVEPAADANWAYKVPVARDPKNPDAPSADWAKWNWAPSDIPTTFLNNEKPGAFDVSKIMQANMTHPYNEDETITQVTHYKEPTSDEIRKALQYEALYKSLNSSSGLGEDNPYYSNIAQMSKDKGYNSYTDLIGGSFKDQVGVFYPRYSTGDNEFESAGHGSKSVPDRTGTMSDWDVASMIISGMDRGGTDWRQNYSPITPDEDLYWNSYDTRPATEGRIKFRNILSEQRPMFQDTPNELAYIDFKKWAYKNRKKIKAKLLDALGARKDGTKLFVALADIWRWDWANKFAKEWSLLHSTGPSKVKFGRALAVMMKKDNLIITKSGNMLTTLKEQNESIQGYHTLMEDGIGDVNGHSISLEIEESPEGLQRGLMHREEFPSGNGMLLKFGKDSPANIWMKNVNFPLDVIYIQDGKVVDMFKNAKPDMGDGLFDHIKGVMCDMVLELPAGDADKYKIELGSMFGFNDLRNERMHEKYDGKLK